ncbi:MAG: PorT family protein [Mangrovimonas sp.]|nr:PorT family protein [Mangrovimonas sp.]MCB0438858.1 PorT family protein [Mangrovimonas sp.]HPF98309.1 porin family protein [Mangrovimonas sp.]
MKRLLPLVALVLVSFYGFSQDTQYGVRAGLNVSNLDFEPHPNFENRHRNGFMIGFFAEYSLSSSIALAPEIQYSAEGGKADELRVDYLHLPVLFKFKFGNFAVGVGPEASLKIHEYEDGYKNFVFSGVGGIEYTLWDDFFIDVRFDYGFMNITDDDNPWEAKNQNIQFGFGVKI